MPEKDSLRERDRSLEEDYFRKKDRELIEKMRHATAAEEERQALAKTSGLTDPALLQELKDLGFTPATVSLLPLVDLPWTIAVGVLFLLQNWYGWRLLQCPKCRAFRFKSMSEVGGGY